MFGSLQNFEWISLEKISKPQWKQLWFSLRKAQKCSENDFCLGPVKILSGFSLQKISKHSVNNLFLCPFKIFWMDFPLRKTKKRSENDLCLGPFKILNGFSLEKISKAQWKRLTFVSLQNVEWIFLQKSSKAQWKRLLFGSLQNFQWIFSWEDLKNAVKNLQKFLRVFPLRKAQKRSENDLFLDPF